MQVKHKELLQWHLRMYTKQESVVCIYLKKTKHTQKKTKETKHWNPGSSVRGFKEGLLASCGSHMTSFSAPVFICLPPLPSHLSFGPVGEQQWSKRSKGWMFSCRPCSSACASFTAQLSVIVTLSDFQFNPRGQRVFCKSILNVFGEMTTNTI